MLKLKLQYFGQLMWRTDLLEKTLMLGKVKCRRRRGWQRMVGWHHGLRGHEFEQAPGVCDGQGGLVCCDSWGRKESDMTERLNWTELNCTEAEDIKKRWQEYTELYKKDLHNPDNHDGVITHIKTDILECEVKWALESITTNKASGGDGIPVELFQILEDDAVKVLALNMPANLENWAVATGLEKVSFQSNPKERLC